MAAFQSFVTRRIRGRIRSPLYYLVLVLLAIIVGGLLTGAAGVRIHQQTFIIAVVLGVVFWWIISRLYRTAVRPRSDGSLVGRRRVELDDDGIRQVAALHDAKTKWAGILSIDETPTHVFLMTDNLAGYIIPRRAFASAADAETFVACARERARGKPL